MALEYAKKMQFNDLNHITGIKVIDSNKHLGIDSYSRQNLRTNL